MMWRRLPPVHSPLTLRAMLSGVVAGLAGGTKARARVTAQLRTILQPERIMLTDSGTTALTLALQAVSGRSGPNSIVALPCYCCYDVATAADGANVRVALYDVDPETLGPDWASLERALALGARTVVVAHLYGIPVDLARVRATAQPHGAIIIEDAAQGAGATVAGRPAGSIGALGVLSFGRGKGVTGGGGGALLANDAVGTELVLEVEGNLERGSPGWTGLASTLAQWGLARPILYQVPAALPFLELGETAYRPVAPTRVMASTSAGLLSRTQSFAVSESARRQQVAQRLLGALEGCDRFRPIVAQHGDAGYLRLPVLMRGRELGIIAARYGIMPGYASTLADLSRFRPRVVNADDPFPGARRLVKQLITLPTHGLLTPKDCRRVERWVDSVMALERLPDQAVSLNKT